jgi:hypothetical protein
MTDQYFGFSKAVHEKAENIINQDILANQTSLVNCLMELVAQRSIEGECIYQENRLMDYARDRVVNLEDYCLESIEAHLMDTLDMSMEEILELPACDREELAIRHGYQHAEKHIYEWWLVSPYIAEKLEYINEPILRTGFGIYWGRTCSEQSIIADGVVQQFVDFLDIP